MLLGGRQCYDQLMRSKSSPDTLQARKQEFVRDAIWTAAIDETLDDNAFIVPGLGDAGDRAYGTR